MVQPEVKVLNGNVARKENIARIFLLKTSHFIFCVLEQNDDHPQKLFHFHLHDAYKRV